MGGTGGLVGWGGQTGWVGLAGWVLLEGCLAVAGWWFGLAGLLSLVGRLVELWLAVWLANWSWLFCDWSPSTNTAHAQCLEKQPDWSQSV